MPDTSTITRYSRKVTYDDDIESVQDAIENAFRSFEDCPLLDGYMIKDVTLVAGDNIIEHKLGRELQGYMITRNSVAVDLHDEQEGNGDKDKTLMLNSSADVIVNIWVF